MITFIIYVLYTLHAPWWVYVLSIIGVLIELDSSDFVQRGDRINLISGRIEKGD
jgi:hypothetical protein